MVLYAQQLLRCAGLTISAVGELTGLSWKTLHELDKAQLKCCYETLDLSDVRNIAIDEFSVHKNHRYATVVLDKRYMSGFVGRTGQIQSLCSTLL